MSKCIAAHTNAATTYPGFINFTREDDGSVSVHFRGNPLPVNGEYICGHAVNKGQAGRCTPGDEHCNNYCNMAPQKGPMQKAPLRCSYTQPGVTELLTLSDAEFREFIKGVIADLL
jgi:hypothetical protein